MRKPFSLSRRGYYPWIFLALVLVANAFVLLFLPSQVSPEMLLSVTGSVAALIHFLYAQHNHNTEQFIGLFQDFNARYDQLNGRLNTIVERDDSFVLTAEDTQVLYDYFNLCAEEFLYFKSGYIDLEVWSAWLRGMKFYASKPEIRRLWEADLQSGSYYGFTLEIIDTAH